MCISFITSIIGLTGCSYYTCPTFEGHSRDVQAKTVSTSDSLVPSRVRHLNAESNVQSRITQFQHNANVSATRALSNPSTKGHPLVLGPSQISAVAPTTVVDLPSQSHSSAVDKSLIDRLDSIQRLFDQSLRRALQENASQTNTNHVWKHFAAPRKYS